MHCCCKEKHIRRADAEVNNKQAVDHSQAEDLGFTPILAMPTTAVAFARI